MDVTTLLRYWSDRGYYISIIPDYYKLNQLGEKGCAWRVLVYFQEHPADYWDMGCSENINSILEQTDKALKTIK